MIGPIIFFALAVFGLGFTMAETFRAELTKKTTEQQVLRQAVSRLVRYELQEQAKGKSRAEARKRAWQRMFLCRH